MPVIAVPGRVDFEPLVSVDADTVIVEAVKPCEDAQNAYIVRLYEAEGTYTRTDVTFCRDAKRLALTDMLEEERETLAEGPRVSLTFRPFEIKTVKVIY